MNNCQRCGSSRVLEVSGNVANTCCIVMGQNEVVDCVPDNLGIGGGDFMEFEYCLECGQIQDTFPVDDPEWESENDYDDYYK
jgi:hypothetical protein